MSGRGRRVLDLLALAIAGATEAGGAAAWSRFSTELGAALESGDLQPADLDAVFAPLLSMPASDQARLADLLASDHAFPADLAGSDQLGRRARAMIARLSGMASHDVESGMNSQLADDERKDLALAPWVVGLTLCAADGHLSDIELHHLQTSLVPGTTTEPLLASLITHEAEANGPAGLEVALDLVSDYDEFRQFVDRASSVTRRLPGAQHDSFWVAVLTIGVAAAAADEDDGVINHHESAMLARLLDQLHVSSTG